MIEEILLPLPVEKDLEAEANVEEDIVYFNMAGASRVTNFRSPDAYVFIFFRRSAGWHTIDFVQHEGKDYQVHISFPGQIHSWNSEACTQGYKLIVSKYFMEKYMYGVKVINSRINRCPILDLDEESFKRIFGEVRRAVTEFSIEKFGKEMRVLRAQLIITMINQLLMDQQGTDLGIGNKSFMFHQFSLLVDQHILTEGAVVFYAKALAITPNYLNILCRRSTGINAKAFIGRRRILEAKRLLLGSDLSIKEISFTLGFKSIGGFSRYLKANTGFYPTEYRTGKVKEMISDATHK